MAPDDDAGAPPLSQAAPVAVGAAEGGDRYEVQGVLGRGGMGRVVAVRDRRLGRVVARKELLPGVQADRLAREASLTARLNHPGIVAVLDAGSLEDGRAYYTMPVVPGRTLHDAMADHATAGARRPLLRQVLGACEAVAYAHQAGIVHRDLKPSNLLIGRFGEVLVADWGLAATVDEAGLSAEGTPGYAAPEQLAGGLPRPTADVFSLGVILHELLAGALPGAAPRWTPPPELAAVIRRATAPDPADRYPDAGPLAADLGAWFDGAEVRAHTYSTRELLGRALWAWRAPLGVLGAALLASAAVIGATYVETARARDAAVAANARANAQLGALLAVQADAAAARGAWVEADRLARASLAAAPSAEARGVLAAVGVATVPPSVDAARAERCERAWLSADGDAWLCLDGDQLSRWSRGAEAPAWTTGPARDVGWSGAGGVVLVRHPERATVRLLDADDGRALGDVPMVDGLVPPVQGFGPQAVLVERGALLLGDRGGLTRIAGPCGAADPHVVAWGDGRLWGVCRDGAVRRREGDGWTTWGRLDAAQSVSEPTALAVSGDIVAIGLFGGRLVRLGPGGVIGADEPGVGTVRGIAADGGRLVVVGESGGPVVLDAVTGGVRHRLGEEDRGPVSLVGASLVTLGASWRRWSLPDTAPLAVLPSPVGLGAAAWTGDGRALALAGGDGSVVRWPLDAGQGPTTYRWQASVVKGLVADGDRVLAVATRDSDVRALGSDGVVSFAAVDPHGVRRVGRVGDGVWAAPFASSPVWIAPGARARPLGLPVVTDGADAPDGRAAVLMTASALWRLGADGDVTRLPVVRDPRWTAVAVASDGVVAAVQHREVVLFAADGAPVGALAVGAQVHDLAWSGRGELAVGTRDGEVIVWRDPANEPEPWLRYRGHHDRVAWLGFSPGDDRLASASWDGTARVWGMARD